MAVLTKCNSFTDADHILGNRDRKKIGHNTYLQRNGNAIEAIYHSTAVVTYFPNGVITANTGGWYTVTTKDRLNQLLPTRVWSDRGIWYVAGSHRFFDGIQFNSDGNILNPLPESDQKYVDAYNKLMKNDIKKYIDAYLNELTLNGLPMPSGADCWYCCGMDSKENPQADHLVLHMEESYFVPSLAVAALREKGYQDAGIYVFLDMQPEQNCMGGRSTDYGTRVSVDTVRRAMRKYMQKRLLKRY